MSLQGEGFTLVAMPKGLKTAWNSNKAFSSWRRSLPCKDRARIDAFVADFKAKAPKQMKERLKKNSISIECEEVDIAYFHMSPGKFLVFRADLFYHGSIFPFGGKNNVPRAYLILHALNGNADYKEKEDPKLGVGSSKN